MRFHVDRYLKDMCLRARQNWRLKQAQRSSPEAAAAYSEVHSYLEERSHTLDVVTKKNILYVPIQKNATSLIRRSLSELGDMRSYSIYGNRVAKYGNPETFDEVPIEDFYRVLTSPDAFRFTLTRNPYDRLVSAWASKFDGVPLVPSKRFSRGNPSIDIYLKWRQASDSSLPEGAGQSLSFEQFAEYAMAVCEQWEDPHIQTQSSMIDVPLLELNFIGKFESLNQDITRLLDFGNASDELRDRVLVPVNPTARKDLTDYYKNGLTEKVYQAYEQDFDRFQYSSDLGQLA